MTIIIVLDVHTNPNSRELLYNVPPDILNNTAQLLQPLQSEHCPVLVQPIKAQYGPRNVMLLANLQCFSLNIGQL